MSGGGSETTSSNLPPQYVMDQHQANLGVGNILADRPYTPYSGPRIANWTPDQQAGFQAVRDSANATSNMGMGWGVANGVANGFTPGQIATTDMSKYMSPYISNVVDTTSNAINRQNQIALQNVGSQALSQGAYGGSRQGVAQAETNRGYADTMANTTANLYNTGYNTALQSAQNDINTQMSGQQLKLAAAQQMAASVLAKQQRDFGNAQALMGIGGQQQGLNQQNLDLAYQDFQNQRDYPTNQLMFRNGLLSTINPGANSSSSTKTDNTGQLVGSGMMAAATVAAAFM